jgi:hypothetical protein
MRRIRDQSECLAHSWARDLANWSTAFGHLFKPWFADKFSICQFGAEVTKSATARPISNIKENPRNRSAPKSGRIRFCNAGIRPLRLSL